MALRERFELAGEVVKHRPPDEAWDFKPVFVVEDDDFVDGTWGQSNGPTSRTLITVQPDASYTIPLETMLAWRAAHASQTPVTLVETYSNPNVTRAWTVTIRDFTPKGRGGGRDRYSYTLTLIGGPL